MNTLTMRLYIPNTCVYIIHHLLHNHYGCMTCVSLTPPTHHSFTLSSSSSPASILFMFHFWIFHIFWLLLLLLLFDVSTLCPPAYIMRKIVCIVCPVLNFTWRKILCWCSFACKVTLCINIHDEADGSVSSE